MEVPSKQTRARSKAAKEKQMLSIINAGRKLFLNYGPEGMSMRMLAKEIGMGKKSASSLYTYVKSKRELWFAIIRHDFRDFERRMVEIYQNHSGTTKKLLIKIAALYFNFAEEDRQRYKMMFQTPAPISKQIGPIEKEYESRTVFMLKDMVTQAVKQGEFKEQDVGKLSYFLWGILHGPITVIDTELFGTKQKLPDIGSENEFYNFMLGYMEKIMDIL